MKLSYLIFILPLFHGCFTKQYRVSLISLQECKVPDIPYASPLPYKLNLEVFNNTKGYSLVRGNLSVPADIPGRDKRGNFSYGIETHSGVSWHATLKDLTCTSFVAKAILGGYGIPLKGCMLKKGHYDFKDIDVDAIDTGFTASPARIYGVYITRGSIFSKTETLACWVTRVKVAPLKKP